MHMFSEARELLGPDLVTDDAGRIRRRVDHQLGRCSTAPRPRAPRGLFFLGLQWSVGLVSFLVFLLLIVYDDSLRSVLLVFVLRVVLGLCNPAGQVRVGVSTRSGVGCLGNAATQIRCTQALISAAYFLVLSHLDLAARGRPIC